MFNIIFTCSIFESCSLVYNQCDHLYSNSSSHTTLVVRPFTCSAAAPQSQSTTAGIRNIPMDLFRAERYSFQAPPPPPPLFFWSHLSRTYSYYILYHINNNLWSLQEIIFFSGHDLNLFHARHHHQYQIRLLDWGMERGGREVEEWRSISNLDRSPSPHQNVMLSIRISLERARTKFLTGIWAIK